MESISEVQCFAGMCMHSIKGSRHVPIVTKSNPEFDYARLTISADYLLSRSFTRRDC